MSARFRLRVAGTSEDLLRVFAVRAVVFCGEQGVAFGVEHDGRDGQALHVLGEVGGEPVAAGRARFPSGAAKLERIAVRKEHRGRGYGRRLLEFLVRRAAERGCAVFKVHAQAQTRRFYEKLGFSVQGRPFLEAGIPHLLMEKRHSQALPRKTSASAPRKKAKPMRAGRKP